MKLLKTSVLFLFFCLSLIQVQAQETMEELKAAQDSIMLLLAEKKAEVSKLQSKANSIQDKIEKLSGWQCGFGGNVGFGFNRSDNWIANNNPNSSASRLAIGLSGYANNIKEKTLWRNSGFLTKEWQDVDQNDTEDPDKLFDETNETVDLLNIASLYGYRFHPKLAATGLGELNTSLGNFLSPGTADIGVGVTWTPNDNFVLIAHPLNYHFAFSDYEDVENTSALGAKLRAEYNKSFTVAKQGITLSSTLTSFIPYTSETTLIDPMVDGVDPWQASLFEYTWINNLSFNLWKGIGVGIGFGFRGADFESLNLQKYYSLGLTYSL